MHIDDPFHAVPAASHPPTEIATPHKACMLCTTNRRAKHQLYWKQPWHKKKNWRLQRCCNDAPMLPTSKCTTLTLTLQNQLHLEERKDHFNTELDKPNWEVRGLKTFTSWNSYKKSLPHFDLCLGDRLAQTILNPCTKVAQNPKSNPTYAIAPKR